MSAQVILSAIKAYAGQTIGGLDSAGLLYATAATESSLGRNTTPRFESSYAPGGSAYKRSALQRELWENFGPIAASSVGPFQILPVTAYELGFKGPPERLNDVFVSAPIVLEFYKKRFEGAGGTTAAQAYTAYNGGNIHSKHVSQANLDRFLRNWDTFLTSVKPKLVATVGAGAVVLVVLGAIAFLAAKKNKKP